MSDLSEKQVQALRLVDCGTRMRLTHHGNTLVSRQAKSLTDAGLIRQAPERWIAYELTEKGRRVLDTLTTPQTSDATGKRRT